MADVIYEGKWSDHLWDGRNFSPESVDQAFELAVKTAADDVAGIVAACSIADGQTSWRIVALAGNWLVVLDASAPVDDWTRDYDRSRHGSQVYLQLEGQRIEVRLLPVASVVSIEAVDPIGKRSSQVNDERKLVGQWTIVLQNERLELPIADPHSLSGSDPAADLVQALSRTT